MIVSYDALVPAEINNAVGITDYTTRVDTALHTRCCGLIGYGLYDIFTLFVIAHYPGFGIIDITFIDAVAYSSEVLACDSARVIIPAYIHCALAFVDESSGLIDADESAGLTVSADASAHTAFLNKSLVDTCEHTGAFLIAGCDHGT